MDTKKAISLFGGKSALAKALGVSRCAVSQWLARSELPPMRVWQIRALRPECFDVSGHFVGVSSPGADTDGAGFPG